MKYLKCYKVFELKEEDILPNIDTIQVRYIDFDGKDQTGSILCNRKVSNELISIFDEIYDLKFPIYQIKPIEYFNFDDEESVRNNNTSCYCFRFIIGSDKLSDHATGNAIDINPFQNPWVHPSAHKIEGRKYDESQKGTITPEIVNIFKKYGWHWGGNWKNPDYQHFFKPDVEYKKTLLK